MSDATNIEWTDTTWNPVRGCSKVSPGCANCYAERTAARQAHSGYAGLVRIGEGSPRWTGEVRLVPEKLNEPLSWRKPRRVFVNSMSDLFHEKLLEEDIARVFDVMERAQQHTFQVLTKRAAHMRDFILQDVKDHGADEVFSDGTTLPRTPPLPLPNVWLGVSVENQAAADERIPLLLETPAAVRFLSVEPLLGPVDLRLFSPFRDAILADRLGQLAGADPGSGFVVAKTDHLPRLDWVIVGGESGPGARPCDVAWIRSVVEQCKAARVPCFVKQLGAHPTNSALPVQDRIVHVGSSLVRFKHDGGLVDLKGSLRDRKGGDMAEWPEDLRVRQFPEARS